MFTTFKSFVHFSHSPIRTLLLMFYQEINVGCNTRYIDTRLYSVVGGYYEGAASIDGLASKAPRCLGSCVVIIIKSDPRSKQRKTVTWPCVFLRGPTACASGGLAYHTGTHRRSQIKSFFFTALADYLRGR